MAIYDHKYGELPYFRVFRAWGGKEHQEYVRIKRSRDAAYKKAIKIDQELAKRQRAHYMLLAYTVPYHIRSDGRIRGMRYVEICRKGRLKTEVFELRINIPWEEKVRRTTISIKVHGFDNAFKMAIDKIGEWYGLDQQSEIRDAMLETKAAYLSDSLLDPLEEETHSGEDSSLARFKNQSVQRAKEEVNALKAGLLNAVKKFRNE